MKKMRRYKFRAECEHDAIEFFKRLYNVKIEKGLPYPDVVVEIDIPDEKIHYMDVIQKAKEVEDGHVIVETISPIERYTGKRRIK